MASREIRVGLVGAGGIGRAHLSAWSQVPGVRITGVVDPETSRAEGAAKDCGASAFASIEEFLAGPTPDAVDICTPPNAHRAPAEAALAAGAHVICEKPLADTPPEARALRDAATASGKLLMTAFCHRFHPPVVEVRRRIDAGELGQVSMFRNRFAGPFAGIENVWFSRPEVSGGGCLMDTSVHSIDLFRFLVGEVASASGAMLTVLPALEGRVEDTAIVLLTAETGAIGVVEASWALPAGPNVVEVYGTAGVAFVHYWDGFTSRIKTSGMTEFAPLPEEGDRFVAELAHFAGAVRGDHPLAVTGDDGVRAVEVVHEAYRSAGR